MKKSLIIFGIVYFLLVIVGASVFAGPKKNKYHRNYDCKQVGVQKVKPYNFRMKKIRHFGYITGSKSKSKLRS